MAIEQEDRDLEITRKRLQAWGKWTNIILTSGLDFASKSIMAQLIEAKGMIIRSTVKNYIPENPEAERVDVLINQLQKIHPSLVPILKYHYTHRMLTKNKATYFKLNKRTYRRYLIRAEQWIDKRLN